MSNILTNQSLLGIDISDIVKEECDGSKAFQAIFDNTVTKLHEDRYFRYWKDKSVEDIRFEDVIIAYKKALAEKFVLDDSVKIEVFDLKLRTDIERLIYLSANPEDRLNIESSIIKPQISKIMKKYKFNNCGLVTTNYDLTMHVLFVGFVYDFNKACKKHEIPYEDTVSDDPLMGNLRLYINKEAGTDYWIGGFTSFLDKKNNLYINFEIDSNDSYIFDGIKCVKYVQDGIIEHMKKDFDIMPVSTHYEYMFGGSDYECVIKYKVTEKNIEQIRSFLMKKGYNYTKTELNQEFGIN